MSDRIDTVAVVGLGKLGSPMAAVFARHGFKTVGLDVDPRLVAAMNEGRAPVQEPRLQDTIDAGRANLRATLDYDEAIPASDAIFVILPTPSAEDHTFSNRFLAEAMTRIGMALRQSDRYHLVVITSTVMPGSTATLTTLLEAASGRKVGTQLGVCYSPEFIALGSVIDNMERPDMVLIGQSDDHAGTLLADVYRRITLSSPEVHRMNFVNAEICKIALNTYVTMKISYANMIADLCDHVSGADAYAVTAALGADSRIGKKYLRGATAYGGPCFPRDNKAFVALARGLGVNCDLPLATDSVNDHQILRSAQLVEKHAAPGGAVAILGLSYKPDTAVIDHSHGIGLARLLADRGYKVTVTDPRAIDLARQVLGDAVVYAGSPVEALETAEVALIMTPWPEFSTAFPRARPLTVIDPWRVLQGRDAGAEVTLITPGRCA